MADNVLSNPGTGGVTFAADEISAVYYPRTKITLGADGVNEGDVASGNPLPVTGTIAVSGTVPVSGSITASGTITVGNTVSVASHAVTNAGTFAVQVDGAALTSLQLIDDAIITDDGGFTPASGKVIMIGLQADETSTDSVDEGDGGAPRMTLDRKAIVTPQPHTKGGLTTGRSLDLDETEEEVKASAGQVYGWNITNFATSTRYVKFYNATAANVTVGTTTPLFTLAIPGNATDDTMLAQSLGGMGIEFDTAITWAATTGLADNDTGAPAANDVAGTVWYK